MTCCRSLADGRVYPYVVPLAATDLPMLAIHHFLDTD
jgi:hypothetical protein